MSTFTIEDIAVAAHHKLGLDTARATEILGDEIREMEKRDARKIDPNALGERDTGALIDAIELAHPEVIDQCMDSLTHAARESAHSDCTRLKRDQAVRAAVSAGVRWSDIMRATGLSRGQVAEIRKADKSRR